MKRFCLLGCVVIIAIAASFTLGKSLKNNVLAYLALAHVEALSQNESGNGQTDKCWTYFYQGLKDYNTCTPGEAKKCSLTAWVKPHDDYKHECKK